MTTDVEKWRKKYFDSLSSLEGEQQQFRSVETTLKRLVGRLCMAALGRSVRLDEQLRKLQAAIRREKTNSEELDRLTPALTDAVQALDQSNGDSPPIATGSFPRTPPSTPAKQAVAAPETGRIDDRVRTILAALLAEVRRDTALTAQVDALDAKISAPTVDLPEILSALTGLVGQRIQRIEQARQEVEGLLSQMVTRLDEIGKFVVEQHQNQRQSQASSETLNVQLTGEMRAMGESVEAAADVQQLRLQVRSRLDSINRHLQEFHVRETSLSNAMHARNEQMHSRIAELEAEARHLQHQLHDEQRLSTIDALTKIPNRLAYERRIEEEFARWQRFRQPTCIVVLDVDHFKRINDAYGHRAGDRVLRSVAECFAGRIRNTDFVARYGGEEFVLILPGTQLEDATRLTDEMRSAVQQIGFHFRGTPVSITVSSGVTSLQPGDSSAAAFDRADHALYQAKEAGRNRCVSV